MKSKSALSDKVLAKAKPHLESFSKKHNKSACYISFNTESEKIVRKWLEDNEGLQHDEKTQGLLALLKTFDHEPLALVATVFIMNSLGDMVNLYSMHDARELDRILSGIKKTESANHSNNARVEGYAAIQNALFDYWKKNINSAKRATDAAILLEKTDIWINAKPQPKRSTVENWIRKWQQLPKD